MRILFLTPQLPFPPQQGAALRNFYLIKGVSQTHQVDLLSFLEPDQSLETDLIQPLLACLNQLNTVQVPQRSTAMRLVNLLFSTYPDMGHRLHSHRFEERLVDTLNTNDYAVVQIEGIELARTIPLIHQHAPDTKILFDAHNAEAELQSRIFQTDSRSRSVKQRLKAIYSQIQVKKLERFESWACNIVDRVTAVSKTDASHLNNLIAPQKPRAVSIPNAIDLDQWRFKPEMPPSDLPAYDLLFTGKMDYRPNVDAIGWFVSSIWPQIQKIRPQTTLGIVGKNPTADILAYRTKKNIDVTGFVPEIRNYLLGAKIIIMPLRMGSGTRLKMIQALAAGKGIVSTSLGAEGFPTVSGEHLLLADSESQFSESIISLLSNPSLRESLGRAGQQLVEHYDYRVVTPQLLKIYAEIA